MKDKREFSQRVADDIIIPINMYIDGAIMGIENLENGMEEVLKHMNDRAHYLAAFPTQETMDEADVMKADAEYFKAILNLINTRKALLKQHQEARKPTTGQAIMNHLTGGSA